VPPEAPGDDTEDAIAGPPGDRTVEAVSFDEYLRSRHELTARRRAPAPTPAPEPAHAATVPAEVGAAPAGWRPGPPDAGSPALGVTLPSVPPAGRRQATVPREAGRLARVLASPAAAQPRYLWLNPRLDAAGRLQQSEALAALGWRPGDVLSVSLDGAWAVLRATGQRKAERRSRGRCVAVDGDGRFTVPKGFRCQLGLEGGRPLVCRVDPDDGSLRVASQAVLEAALGPFGAQVKPSVTPAGTRPATEEEP